MANGPLSAYRNPTGMFLAILGLLVTFGGLWSHLGGLVLLGVLTTLLGHRAVEYLAADERSAIRRGWGQFLDNLSDPLCLLLNLVGALVLLGGCWGRNPIVVLLGALVAGAGHFYVHRNRNREQEVPPPSYEVSESRPPESGQDSSSEEKPSEPEGPRS